MTPVGQAKEMVERLGKVKALEICDYFLDDDMLPKMRNYWEETKQEIIKL